MGRVCTKQFESNYQGKKGKWCSPACSVFDSCAKNLKEFLRVDANKKELFSFLAEQIPTVDFGQGKQVITTKGEQVLCSPLRLDTCILTPCNHEEADTRMLVHAADASKAGYKIIIIRTVDTDVVIISIAMTQNLHINELWIAFGTGSNLRYLAAHEIASRLGPEKQHLCLYSMLLLDVTLFLVSLVKARRPHGTHGWLMKKQSLPFLNYIIAQKM